MSSKIKEMIENGFSVQRTAKILKISVNDVKNEIKNNSLSIKKENFIENQETLKKIIDLYHNGVSAKSLGKKYGIDKRRVFKWAKKEGILRTNSESRRLKQFDDHAFDKIETEQQAYWLGFLYADAYNYEKRGFVRLALKIDDIDHMKKYVQFMGGTASEIKTFEVKVKNKKTGEIKKKYACKFNINSKHLSKKLSSLGCMQGKSHILKFPNWLDEKLQHHFIRGYFDGDGCLSKRKSPDWKWSLVGTKEMCESIQKIFSLNGVDINYHCISKTNKNTYGLESAGNLKIEKICDYLYRNATVYMDRKYNRYKLLKNRNIKVHNRKNESSFADIIIFNNLRLSTKNIKNLSIEDKEKLTIDLSKYIINKGFQYPDNIDLVNGEYKRLVNRSININETKLNNNSSSGTYICKYFCKSFFTTRTDDEIDLISAFSDEKKIIKAIRNRLGLDGYDPKCKNLSFRTIANELKTLKLCSFPSIFKPNIAKYMCEKYSKPEDVVGDYSCGFGARMLGAMASGRKYVGTDPLTVPELQRMADHFGFNKNDCRLIDCGSEYYRGEENSVDLYWSSPPYYDLEVYSDSKSQAYNQGPSHFYNKYWRNTLENVKYMLKPGKWFGLNVNDKHYKMVEIAKEYFGDVVEEIELVSNRHHYNKYKIKIEKIYMFKNNK